MVELSSGCICCSIDDYRFDLAIQEIVETVQPHLIIIESTGLADPEPLAYRVKNAGLHLDAIDHGRRRRERRALPAARPRSPAAQIAAADFLVVNKIDLVGSPRRWRGSATRLARLNPRALQLETVRGAIDADVLFATDVAAHRERAREPRRARPATWTDDGFDVVPLPEPGVRSSSAAFERVLGALPADVIRAKGIVRFVDRDWHCLFNVTCGRRRAQVAEAPGGPPPRARRSSSAANLARHRRRRRSPCARQGDACPTANPAP